MGQWVLVMVLVTVENETVGNGHGTGHSGKWDSGYWSRYWSQWKMRQWVLVTVDTGHSGYWSQWVLVTVGTVGTGHSGNYGCLCVLAARCASTMQSDIIDGPVWIVGLGTEIDLSGQLDLAPTLRQTCLDSWTWH